MTSDMKLQMIGTRKSPTTILAYKGKNKAVIGGDGQVTFGD